MDLVHEMNHQQLKYIMPEPVKDIASVKAATFSC